jgi:cold shock protein
MVLRGTGAAQRPTPQHRRASMATNDIVKFFNARKGFGFIEPVQEGKDAYVNATAVELAGLPTLREGQKVSYDIERGEDGKESAVNVRAL